jgi:toxin ParE1/3/4
MSLPVVLRPEAEDDLLAGRDWYEQQSDSLRDDFAAKVEDVLSRISVFPELYPALLRNVRAAKLRRFPYLIYYRVQGNYVEVLAVLHGSRDPRIWQGRAE